MATQGASHSPNCEKDGTPAMMYTYFAHTPSDPTHKVKDVMLSCGKMRDGAPKHCKSANGPDHVTNAAMRREAARELSRHHGKKVAPEDVVLEAHCSDVGGNSLSAIAEELSRRRMASNCAPHYNLNSVTSYNKFKCRYMGTGIDDEGQKVYNPFQEWNGTLPSCDNGIDIPEDVELDIRRLAWHAADGEKAKLNVDEFLCSIQSLPIQ